MKKLLKSSLLLILLVIFTTGCTKVTKCTLTSNQSASGYTLKSTYNIYSNKDVVDKVEWTEEYESKNTTTLAYFEKQLNDQYKSNNDKYKGYTYTVTNENGKVISKVTLDYSVMDIDKFIEDNPAMKSFMNSDNKVTLEGQKAIYETAGATCE